MQTKDVLMMHKRLGEIVLRTTKLNAMIAFYRDIIGLHEYQVFEKACFLQIADDLPGHPQLLVLFDASIASNGPGEPPFAGHDTWHSPLHHFAFAVDLADFASEQERLAGLGYELRTATHLPMQWRSFYLYDPDGNVVEYVCHDTSIGT
jgi:catechol 2,3-dioxygenase-like lactoylglutathione lyase family enzyme